MISQSMSSVCLRHSHDGNLKGCYDASFKTWISYFNWMVAVAATAVVRTLIRGTRGQIKECVFQILPTKALDYS